MNVVDGVVGDVVEHGSGAAPVVSVVIAEQAELFEQSIDASLLESSPHLALFEGIFDDCLSDGFSSAFSSTT